MSAKAVGSPLFGAFAPPPTPRPRTQPARTKKPENRNEPDPG
jgi:hypothetical protein